MMSLLAIIAVGLLLGMRHATDPDHVLAVSTIVSRERNLRQAALVGVAWGAGHTLTISLVGSVLISFRVAMPPRLGLAMELAVALMLIALGIRNMYAGFDGSAGVKPRVPHFHAHGNDVHLYGSVRPLIVGIVHGMAGSAAIALLVLSTISSARWAVAYLVVFGFGTVLGMMLITLAMASTFSYGQKRFARIGRHFDFATGLASLAFGLFLSYHISFTQGLFSAHVQWIPR
jgi:hypothetical protein